MPENNTCFVDTNVWLYALIEGQDRVKTETAQSLILQSIPVISTQVINEVCVNLLKKTDISEEHISQLIDSFYAKYPVVEINKTVLLKASQLRRRYSLSYWDSIIVACALAAETEMLYTEDIQNGLVIENQLRIVNPFAT
jgi:predicted nucleic acid-binding protein